MNNAKSDRAVDGNSSMVLAHNSCTDVESNQKPWWRVDLGQDEFVTEVYIVNAIQKSTRLREFEIRVGRLIHLQ